MSWQWGKYIITTRPNSVVRYRILRDVMQLPSRSTELDAAHSQLISHPWVAELAYEQHPDGSWGRFHSMDSTLKKRFPTSEIAIRRALALGLEKDDPILVEAVRFLVAILDGRQNLSDHMEKSESWPIGVEAIITGTIAQVNPKHPSIEKAWTYWVGVAEGSFPAGNYDPRAEWNAHTKIRARGIRYLGSRYVLNLLGSRSKHLPTALDRLLVNWIWNNPEGVGYLSGICKTLRILTFSTGWSLWKSCHAFRLGVRSQPEVWHGCGSSAALMGCGISEKPVILTIFLCRIVGGKTALDLSIIPPAVWP